MTDSSRDRIDTIRSRMQADVEIIKQRLRRMLADDPNMEAPLMIACLELALQHQIECNGADDAEAIVIRQLRAMARGPVH